MLIVYCVAKQSIVNTDVDFIHTSVISGCYCCSTMIIAVDNVDCFVILHHIPPLQSVGYNFVYKCFKVLHHVFRYKRINTLQYVHTIGNKIGIFVLKIS